MNKYTIVVAAFPTESSFVLHIESDSFKSAKEFCCYWADGETGCGPYEVLAVFEGFIENIEFSACGTPQLIIPVTMRQK